MNLKSKLISILLIFIMISAVVVPAFAYDPSETYDEYTDTYTDTTPPATISGTPFLWPLPDYATSIDSPFGFRRATGRNHLGIDVLRPVGSPVFAAASGTVRTSTREGAWGHLIVIDHDYPFERLSTFYAHLNSRDPSAVAGARVEAGQLIGTAGRTGNASASHLHFELRFNNMPVNPMPFFHNTETRADVNPNPLFIMQDGRWVFNPNFDHTFTAHEYVQHRQGNSRFLLPSYASYAIITDPDAPPIPQEAPGVIYDPADLGLIPQTPDIIDSFAFGASGWAAEEIDEAIYMGILPENLLYDFQNEITRAEFAETAVRTILVLSGAITETDEDEFAQYVSMLITGYNPFDDTDNTFVIIAHYLYIVTGVAERTFAPDNPITRQEAATMLARIAVAFDITEPGASQIHFADSNLFAPWAYEAIGFVSSYGIMGGVGNDLFSPLGPYTREQTFVTMSRLAGVIGG